MSELVRVRLNGFEKSVGVAFAESNGLEVLDEPARYRDGRVRPITRVKGRPVKPRTSVADAVAAKKETQAPAPATSTPEEANE